MTDSERIQEIIKTKNLNNVQFCNLTGINPASLSHIMSGRSNPTLAILRSVVSGFPDLNPEWILMGTGSMVRENSLGVASEGSDGLLTDDAKDDKTVESSVSILSNATSGGKHTSEGVGTLSPHSVSTPLLGLSAEDIVGETIKQMQHMPRRRVVEIRVFYDDGTYESFSGHRS